MSVLLVFLGGMIGAPLRYLTDKAVQAHHDSVFPLGTFTVNIVGSFILGSLAALVAAHALPADILVLLGTGMCGALTTFSTFSFETLRLLEDGSLAEAGLNAIGSLLVGVAAAAAGYALLTWL
ncbi:fluoride efflux transporter CrcB [Streptomyces sp. NPDC101151]|uniref:fluoride efflux transporter CrcB n=1 Tax=Streptomyces sp. NPDC101151 TaxID=3366115 RepID=UPI0038092C19